MRGRRPRRIAIERFHTRGTLLNEAAAGWPGFDFLHAVAAAKILNAATNLGALVTFAWTGNVWWSLALPMAVANIAGSWAGSRLAIRHGAAFVRAVFVVVVAALVLKTAYDVYLAPPAA
jgi:uncharacterized membrane protein YfcA